MRRKLPDERHAITHKFDIAGHEGYITVGLFEDGTPGEIFLVMAKEGSTISGFADAFAQAICYALQYGVPLQALVDKFSHVRFEPSGMTKNPDVRFAKSIVDYIFRWMASKFLSPEAQFRAGVNNRDEVAEAGAAALDGRSGTPAASRPHRRRRADASRRVVRRDAEPGRRAAVLDVRVDHGAQRRLLQVRNCGTTQAAPDCASSKRVGSEHVGLRHVGSWAGACSGPFFAPRSSPRIRDTGAPFIPNNGIVTHGGAARRSLPLSVPVFQILLSLVGQDLHGYAIIKDIEARTGGEVRLAASTLYGAIAKLLDGRPHRGSAADGASPRRRTYRLTRAGRRLLEREAERLARASEWAAAKRLLPQARGSR